jgi:pyruvate/2-oxoglutarate dehydrogenase complex dihydrolipoamide dehydrogenase (E3) component
VGRNGQLELFGGHGRFVAGRRFEVDGIDVRTPTACTAVATDGSGGRVACEGEHSGDVVGSHLLLAAGRTPNTDRLGLDHLDLSVDVRGYLDVDGRLRTTVEDVWALADLPGTDMFTHTARDDAEVAYRTEFGGQERTIADRIVPHTVFTDPEIAAVGLTENTRRGRRLRGRDGDPTPGSPGPTPSARAQDRSASWWTSRPTGSRGAT